jgi:hypothetical protein
MANETYRISEQFSMSDDSLPLHLDFYKFVQKDERGYFVADDKGNRWEVIIPGGDNGK